MTMTDNVTLEFIKAGLALSVSAISLLIALAFGQLLTARWSLEQKRKELNLEAVHALHVLYGEFKEVLKIWRVAKDEKPPVVLKPDQRWELLKRACAVEGKTEALVLRLATERCLKDGQAVTIGMFRQAIQRLRQAIRDDENAPIGDRGEEYEFFNRLAPYVAEIVTAGPARKSPDWETAQAQLAKIIAVRSDDWDARIKAMKARN